MGHPWRSRNQTGMGIHRRGTEEEESELRSDWQAEACPTKAVRASLGWTRRSLIPLGTTKNQRVAGRIATVAVILMYAATSVRASWTVTRWQRARGERVEDLV